MTPDEHQRERRAFWDGVCIALCPPPTPLPQMDADALLAERDKRFPAPSTAAPVEAVAKKGTVMLPDSPSSYVSSGELASLRQKARLWDAVASNVRLRKDAPREWIVGSYSLGNPTLPTIFPTAEEAVEAAIAAGALK